MIERIEKIANIAVSLVTIVAILVGGLFAIVEYRSHQLGSRVEKSLLFIDKVSTTDNRRKINEFWIRWENNLSDFIKLTNEDNSAKSYESFVLSFLRSNDLENDVSEILKVFEEAATCVSLNMCDKLTNDKYLFNSGRSFFNVVYPYICEQRKLWNNNRIWMDMQSYYSSEDIDICKNFNS